MYKFIISTLLALVISIGCTTGQKSTSVASPEKMRSIASDTPVYNYTPKDLQVVDKSVKEIIDRLLFREDQVKFARPKFDGAETQIGDEKIKYTLKGKVINTRWSKSGANLDVTTYLSTIRTPESVGAEIVYQSEIKTDILAMIRYGASVALQRDRGYDPDFESKIIGKLKELNQIKSISALADLFKEAKVIAEDLLRHYSTTKSDNSAQWRQMAEAYRSVKIESDANGVRLNSDNPVHFLYRLNKDFSDFKKTEQLEAKEVWLVLGETHAIVNIKLFVRTSSERLDQARRELDKRMSGLKNKDPDISKQVEHEFVDHLRFFKDVINGVDLY